MQSHFPPRDSGQVFASRARAKRQLIEVLKRRLSEHMRHVSHDLPTESRILCQQAMAEALTVIQVQSQVLDELDHTIIELREDQFRQLQIELTETQISESRKAIKQADTVARLTILAFIYIPTSCVCGVFGMNIVETPQGFPLWIFGITLAAILVTTLWIAFAGRFYMVIIQAQYYLIKYLVYRKMFGYGPLWEFCVFLVDIPRLSSKAYRKIRAAFKRGLKEGRHLRPRRGYPGEFKVLVRGFEENISQRVKNWREQLR